MPHPPRCFIFAGPTLYGVAAWQTLIDSRYCILPPVSRGDVAGLTSVCKPAILAIVDGLFHQHLSVAHAEIREALLRGWQVWGLCSMGAIRAFEMRFMGVRGFGSVYERFAQSEDFQDDEVAVLHLQAPPYTALSEPLIHIRTALEDMRRRSLLAESLEQAIVSKLKQMWYGYRTLDVLHALLGDAVAPRQGTIIRENLSSFERYRSKAQDLRSFLSYMSDEMCPA